MKLMLQLCAGLFAVGALGFAPVHAQAPPGLREAINSAIDRGVDFLLLRQNRDGSWGDDLEEDVPHFDRHTACTALVVYTLRKHKLPADHPALRRAVAYLEQRFPTHTYTTSTQLLAFTALDPLAHKKRIQQLAEQLISWQVGATGTWGYPVHGSVPHDLSNTQYAVLGLRAAHQAGIEAPKKLWLELVEGVLAHQESNERERKGPKSGEVLAAGFRYRPLPGEEVTGSMTAAGVAVLGIAKECLGKALDPAAGRKIERAQQLGLAWLEREFTVEGNPHGPGAWHHYYLYGVERVAALCGLERIAGRDWYHEGAAQLVREQADNGSWSSGARVAWPAQPLTNANTCFALLFLMKATGPSSGGDTSTPADTYVAEESANEVWIRASGRSKLTVWMSGLSARVAKRLGVDEGAALEQVRVVRAELWLDGQLDQTVQADPQRPWKGQRLAVQHAFASDGAHVVQLRVFVQRPESAADGELLELRSAELEVVARDVFKPWMLDYAAAEGANKFRATNVRVQASSELSSLSSGARAFDGLQSLAWRFKPDDPAPTLTAEFDKPVRVQSLSFSHANASPLELNHDARITQLALRFNKSSEEQLLTWGGEPLEKLVYQLEKPLVLRTLTVRVVAFEGGAVNPRVSGLAEIEAR